ncbi:MAG: 4Fe-4S dicluster domain-containing protein [Thermofilum sp.]
MRGLEQLFILVLPELCTGCKSCEIACAVERSRTKCIYTAHLEEPRPVPRIRVLLADGYSVPMRCQHCADAPCMAVCPTKAISRSPEGFILLDSAKCIGCLMCARACPFGAVRLDTALRVAVKCDFCFERVRQGRQPACAEACPTRALRFGTLEELMAQVAGAKAREVLKRLSSEAGILVAKPERERGVETPMSPAFVREMYRGAGWV